jgi:hypothetical protein
MALLPEYAWRALKADAVSCQALVQPAATMLGALPHGSVSLHVELDAQPSNCVCSSRARNGHEIRFTRWHGRRGAAAPGVMSVVCASLRRPNARAAVRRRGR